jgi:putative transposase
LQPIAQGLKTEFRAIGADASRGLTLRMDHGTQYTADDFLNQVKFWGIAPSFAFVAGPQTNGVAERFNRTLKEQAIHGRIFKNVEEVRLAVTAFKDRYNCHWRLEKLGFISPLEARQAYAIRDGTDNLGLSLDSLYQPRFQAPSLPHHCNGDTHDRTNP